MHDERTELISSREYSKGDQRQWLYLRLVTVTNGSSKGSFRLETWKNGQEDPTLRLELSDVYAMQRKFIARLLDLYTDGWKREQVLEGEAAAREYIALFTVAGI